MADAKERERQPFLGQTQRERLFRHDGVGHLGPHCTGLRVPGLPGGDEPDRLRRHTMLAQHEHEKLLPRGARRERVAVDAEHAASQVLDATHLVLQVAAHHHRKQHPVLDRRQRHQATRFEVLLHRRRHSEDTELRVAGRHLADSDPAAGHELQAQRQPFGPVCTDAHGKLGNQRHRAGGSRSGQNHLGGGSGLRTNIGGRPERCGSQGCALQEQATRVEWTGAHKTLAVTNRASMVALQSPGARSEQGANTPPSLMQQATKLRSTVSLPAEHRIMRIGRPAYAENNYRPPGDAP